MRRVGRTAIHKDSNHARVEAYSRELGGIFDHWLSTVDEKGYSAPALTTQLDAAAQAWFPQAFAIGRQQAYPKRRPSPYGQEVLATKLLANRHYLHNSFQPDIDARAAKWRINFEDGSLADALSKSFRSRVVDQYGGAIWTVTEAGFRAGVGQARHDLAIRMTGRIMAQEDDEEEDQPQPGDDALAVALGLSLIGLLALLRSGRDRGGLAPLGPTSADQMTPVPGVLEAAGVQVQIDYQDEGDDKVCDECSSNAAGSPYPEDECPLPGEDCEGFGSCRCTLATVVDETATAAAA